jgi:hypothetical protein
LALAATGDTITAIQALVDQLEHCTTAAAAAAGQADEGRTMAAALGHTPSVAAFGAVHDSLGEIQTAVAALIDKAQDAINQTQAIEEG